MVAHSSDVSSLALGKTSGRLLATGGEDYRVNIWAVNKPNCIMVHLCLNIHLQCCVRKRSRMLDGFAPHCVKVVSKYLSAKDIKCSSDNEDCVYVCVCVPQSLTGHTNPVECIQFSSSEEQVVAGSQSGSLRVWDLEAAKSE